MTFYRVHLHCAFVDPLSIEEDSAGGFYTIRFVEASSDHAAAALAIERLQEEPKFQLMLGQLSAPPTIAAERVEPVEPPESGQPLYGYAFYLVDEE